MRKRGLHYFLGLLGLAVVLAGCSAGDSNSAGNNAKGANTSSMESSADSGSAANAAAAPAMAEFSTSESGDAAKLDTTEAQAAGGDGSTAVKNLAAEQAAEGTVGFTGSDVVEGLNKKLIYHANLNMEVADYGAAQTEVRNKVTLAGGYIIEFTENVSEYEQGGTFILKVPASGFSSFLNNLEKVKHEKIQRSIQGQDVSEEYVDLGSRLKAKQLMESQYIEFMKKATKSADLVAFANQLGAIQEEIEQMKGRMRYIDQNVSFSTVELRLYQTEKSVAVIQKEEQSPLAERASDALKSSLNALSVMLEWLVVFLAAALPLLIVAAIILVIVLWFRKKSKRRDEEHIERIRRGNREQNWELANRSGEEQSPSNITAEDKGEETEK